MYNKEIYWTLVLVWMASNFAIYESMCSDYCISSITDNFTASLLFHTERFGEFLLINYLEKCRWYVHRDSANYDNRPINWLRPSDAYMRRKLTIIGSDNGLSHGRRQAIFWTNAGILLNGYLWTNFSIEIYVFSFRKMYLEMPSENVCALCLGLNLF